MTEPEKAKAWRKRHGYTQAYIAELTGFSRRMIQKLERGEISSAAAMVRYKMACAAVFHNLERWDWE
jgi:transcriptional regulator with XRE-family HTH domain